MNCQYCSKSYKTQAWLQKHETTCVKAPKIKIPDIESKMITLPVISTVINEEIIMSIESEESQIVVDEQQIIIAAVVDDIINDIISNVAEDYDNQSTASSEQQSEVVINNTIRSLLDEMINTVVIANELNKCPCGSHKTCAPCQQKSIVAVQAPIIDNIVQYEPQIIEQLPTNIVDCHYDTHKRTMTIVTDTTAVVLRSKDLYVKDYTQVSRQDNDWKPTTVMPSFKIKSLAEYYCSYDKARDHYGHATGKMLQSKWLHDNDITCSAVNEHYRAYVDIETYNEESHHIVPTVEDSKSHVAMIAVVLQHYKDERCLTTTKTVILNNDRRYDISQVAQDITVITTNSEQQACAKFFDMLAELKMNVIVCGYNSSSQSFGTEFGYDLPFIINRSRLLLTLITRVIKLGETKVIVDDEGNVSEVKETIGKALISLTQLPLLHFVDYKQHLWKTASQDDRNALSNQKLESWLSFLSLQSKDDHNYVDLQRRLSTPRAAISDIINYCVRDCTALIDIETVRGIVENILIDQALKQQPLSWSIHQTMVKSVTFILQKLYIQSGQLIAYYPRGDAVTVKFMGAYCDTQAELCKVYKGVISPDYVSLYPSCLMSCNADALTIVTQKQQGGSYYTVDCSDDENTALDSITFDLNKKAILADYVETLFNQRIQAKGFMKSDPTNKARWNSRQLALKITINSIYGLCAYSLSPLFCLEIAIATTALARRATQLGRDFAITQGHTFLAADTDSIFLQLKDPQHTYQEALAVVTQMNNHVQERLQSKRFVLEIEELITAVAFTSRKSYIAILQQGNETKLKCRGISWSKISQQQRDVLLNDITVFLNGDILAQDHFNNCMQREQDIISKAIQTQDITMLTNYAQKVSLSSEKSALVKHIKMMGLDFGDDTHCSVVMLQGQGNKTGRKIPLQLVTKAIATMIDYKELVSTALSMHKKLFLTKDQKKGLFKEIADAQQDLLTEDHIQIRVERLSKKLNKTLRHTEIIHKKALAMYLKMNPDYSIHEILSGSNNMRLAFDLDGSIADGSLQQLDSIVYGLLNCQPQRRVLSSTGNKVSMHVFYDVNVSIQFAKVIAQLCHEKLSSVDTAIYRNNGSLRCPNTIKIYNNEIVNRQFICPYDQVEQLLMTPYNNFISVPMPLHLINRLIIDDYYISKTVASDTLISKVEAYLKSNKIDAELQVSGSFINIRPKQTYMCPIHKRLHDNDSLFAVCKDQRVILFCYRSNEKERQSQDHRVVICDNPVVAKQTTQQKNQAKCDKLIQHCTEQINLLQGAVIQENKYLQCDIAKELQTVDIVAVRSQLGTGKSVALEQYLQHCDNRVVILSHRRSFSADIQSRYNGVLYHQVKGQIDLHRPDYRVVVCQAESIDRLSGTDSCILVIDEIESLLTQLNTSISRNQGAQLAFITLLKNSSKIILLDGFLTQQTVNTIESLSSKSSKVIQNLTKPYTGHTFMLRNYSRKNTQQDTILAEIEHKITCGKKIVVFCTSNSMATTIFDHMHERCQVKFYHGDDLRIDEETGMSHYEQKMNDLECVKLNWQCDLLIYTSTITAGVNFDSEWFDEQYAIYLSNTCNAPAFIQGLCRVRKWKSQVHTLWFQDQYSDRASRPQDTIEREDIPIVTLSQSQQLDIYLRCRSAAEDQYRSSIVMKSLCELGYTIVDDTNHQESTSFNIEEQPSINPAEKYRFLTMPVSENDLKLYKAIKLNKHVLMTTELPEDFGMIYKKIDLLQLVNKDPLTTTLDCDSDNMPIIEHWAYELIEQLSQVLTYRSTMKLLQNDVETIDEIIKSDRQRILATRIQDKSIKRTTVKDLRAAIILYHQVKLFVKDDQINSRDLPVTLTEDPTWQKRCRKAFNVYGYSFNQVAVKKIQGKAYYTIAINPLVNVQ